MCNHISIQYRENEAIDLERLVEHVLHQLTWLLLEHSDASSSNDDGHDLPRAFTHTEGTVRAESTGVSCPRADTAQHDHSQIHVEQAGQMQVSVTPTTHQRLLMYLVSLTQAYLRQDSGQCDNHHANEMHFQLGMKEGVLSGGILPGAAVTGPEGTAALPHTTSASSLAGVAPHPSVSANTPHEHSSSSPLHGCFLCLLSFLLSVVMSAKKATATATNKSGNTSSSPSAIQRSKPRAPQLKRARSVSMSVDLECPRRTLKNQNKPAQSCPANKLDPIPVESPGNLLSRLRPRFKHVSLCEGAERFLAQSAEENGYTDPNYFPFELLPEDCQLKVFSFLNPRERGVAAQVCSDWQMLMRSSSLWTVVDLTIFPQCHTATHDCTRECYTSYRDRTKKKKVPTATLR